MSDSIEIEGEEYISAKRASKETGYTRDYIGQLARGGLIGARRVEGLWYVSLPSLKSHSIKAEEYKSVPPVPSQKLDSETTVVFDGKEFVSASRASAISGYHQDYVSQLARTGKVPSRQMGSRWFVDRDALLAHKQQKDMLLAAVQVGAVGLATSRETTTPSADSQKSHVPSTSSSFTARSEDHGAASFFTYEPQQKADLIPDVSQRDLSPTIRHIRTLPSQRPPIAVGYHRAASDVSLRPQVSRWQYEQPTHVPVQHKRSLRAVHLAPVALTIVVVLMLGFTSLRQKAVYAFNQVQLGGQTAAVASSTSSFADVAEWIESIFSKDIVYQSAK